MILVIRGNGARSEWSRVQQVQYGLALLNSYSIRGVLFAIYAALFIATPAAAIVINCPDGRICAVDDPAKCACVTMCDGPEWVFKGEACPGDSRTMEEREDDWAREHRSANGDASAPSTPAEQPKPARYFGPLIAMLLSGVLLLRLHGSKRWVAVISLALSIAWLVGNLPDQVRATRGAQAQRAQEDRAREVARRDLDERLCTDPELIATLDDLVESREGVDMFVRPRKWDSLPFKARKGLALASAHCLSGGRAVIRHANTGKVLATWSDAAGYEGKE